MTRGNIKLERWLYITLIIYAVVSPISLSATNVALGLIILTGAICIFTKGEKPSVDNKILYLFASLFIWSALTRLIADGKIVKDSYSNIWEYSPILIFPIILGSSGLKKDAIIRTLLIFSSIVCLLGIIQYVHPGIVYPFPKQMIREDFNGFFSHHLHSGGFYSITTVVAFSLVLFWSSDRQTKLLSWMYFLLNLSGLILTMTRSYYIAVSMILLSFLLIKKKEWFIAGSVIFSVLLILTLAVPNPVRDRVKTLFDPNYRSNKERVLMWKAALNMAKDHPLTGVGKGRWTQEATQSYFPVIEKEYDYKIMATAHAHNSYLTVLAETGIIGLLLFLSFWLSVAWGLYSRLSATETGTFDHALIIGTLGGLGNLFVAALFENNFGTSVVLLLISFLIGLSLNKDKPGFAG